MAKNEFTVKDYDRIIDDIIDEYFDLHNIDYDMKELVKSGMLSTTPDLGLEGEQNV